MVQRALEILTDDPNRVKPFWTDIYNPAMCGVFGFASMCFLNAFTRRPVLSGLFSFVNIKKYENYVRNLSAVLGIQWHGVATAIGVTVGKTLDGWRNEHYAEKDAVLRRYVELHPDDFPDPGWFHFRRLLCISL